MVLGVPPAVAKKRKSLARLIVDLCDAHFAVPAAPESGIVIRDQINGVAFAEGNFFAGN